MPLLDWNSQLKLGHAQIDADHKKMVELLNRLHDAALTGMGPKVCSRILSDLIAYSRSHFALEEQLMTLGRYGRRDDHKAEHEELIRAAVEIRVMLDRGELDPDRALFERLKDWVSDHVRGADRELVAALRAAAEAQPS